MPDLAAKALEEITEIKLKVDVFRVINDFVVNLHTYLPHSTVEIINSMKNEQKIEARVLKSECESLVPG